MPPNDQDPVYFPDLISMLFLVQNAVINEDDMQQSNEHTVRSLIVLSLYTCTNWVDSRSQIITYAAWTGAFCRQGGMCEMYAWVRFFLFRNEVAPTFSVWDEIYW